MMVARNLHVDDQPVACNQHIYRPLHSRIELPCFVCIRVYMCELYIIQNSNFVVGRRDKRNRFLFKFWKRDTMGLLTILKKLKRKEKEIRILILYVCFHSFIH